MTLLFLINDLLETVFSFILLFFFNENLVSRNYFTLRLHRLHVQYRDARRA